MTESMEFIYGLYYHDKCFYVGRSGRGLNRSPGVRFKEHQAHARHDTTPVYTFIREQLNAYNIPWREEILCWCGMEEALVSDTEFFWVIKMIRDGHQLYNAKNGDAKRIANAEDAVKSGFLIEQPKDVARYKQFKLDLLKAKRHSNALRLQEKLNASKDDFLEAKVDKKDLISSIKHVEPSLKIKPVATIDPAQIEFDAGNYSKALKLLNGSTLRFVEKFGITYYECINI